MERGPQLGAASLVGFLAQFAKAAAGGALRCGEHREADDKQRKQRRLPAAGLRERDAGVAPVARVETPGQRIGGGLKVALREDAATADPQHPLSNEVGVASGLGDELLLGSMQLVELERVVLAVAYEGRENLAFGFEQIADFLAGLLAERARAGGDLTGQLVKVGELCTAIV